MTRSKKFSPLLFVTALFAVLIGYIELRLPMKVGAQGRDGVYDSLAVTDTGESAVRVAGGVSVHSTAAGALDVAGGIVAGSGNVQVVKADGLIPRTALVTGTGSTTLSGSNRFNTNTFSFVPSLTSGSLGLLVNSCTLVLGRGTSSTIPSWYTNPFCTSTLTWSFLSASDNPSLWILLAADGSVGSIWESEDPAGSDPPLSIPQDDDGHDLPGFTVVNVGLPSLPVIEALYSGLTLGQRTAALTCTGNYVQSRGWLTSFSTLTNLGGIEARYEPSGRQWAQRCAAQAAGVSTTSFYLENLVVVGGAWALP